jgi:sialic acid synthase SpsE
MSTGTAELHEVATSVAEFEATGNAALALMQCTASYPAPIASLNVRAIVTMKTTFGCPVGLSDHSRDPLVGPLTAIGVGANLIEKHYTLGNELPGPDHRFAVEPTELCVMVDRIRNAEQALGSGAKVMDPIEAELRAFARRSVFAVRDIGPGEPLTPENIAVLRCGAQRGGFAPRDFTSLLGRKAARLIAAETAVTADDIA